MNTKKVFWHGRKENWNKTITSTNHKVKIDSNHLATIMYKNNIAVYVMVVISIILIITLNIWGIVFGVVLLAVCLFVIFKIEDYKCFEIYQDAVLIYSDKKNGLVIKIDYNDIKEWTVNNRQQGANGIIFVLNDGKTIAKETFQLNKAYSQLSKVMEEKESRFNELNKLRNEKITLENPFKSKKKK